MSIRRLVFAIIGLLSVVPTSASAFEIQNPADCGPRGTAWAQLPIVYEIHDAGITGWDFADVEAVIATSAAQWSMPACTTFEFQYAGPTADRAALEDGRNTIGFETEWPVFLGNPENVHAAFMGPSANCERAEADIFFNLESFTWIDGEPGALDEADLQSIATHELGHVLGLTHSFEGTTMAGVWDKTLSRRTLHTDDVAGVCHIYPRNCATDAECESGDVCTNMRCESPPCTADADCYGDWTCDVATGVCETPACTSNFHCTESQDEWFCDPETNTCSGTVPPPSRCSTDADCPTNAPICDPDTSLCVSDSCVACLPCETHDDCGSEAFCMPFWEDGLQRNLCSFACDPSPCPGDLVCEPISTSPENGYCRRPPVSGLGIPPYCGDDFVCDSCAEVTCSPGEHCETSPRSATTGECVPDDVADMGVADMAGIGDVGGEEPNNADDIGGPPGATNDTQIEGGCCAVTAGGSSGTAAFWLICLVGLCRRRRQNSTCSAISGSM